MKIFSFTFVVYSLLFGLFSGLCWRVADCSSTSNPRITTTQSHVFAAPDNVQHVTVESSDETSVTIQFNMVYGIRSYVLSYYTNRLVVEQLSWLNPVKYTVSPLTSARTYNMTLYTVDNGVQSTGFSFNATTAPENVAEFKATNQTESSITLEWTKKEGIALYTLKYNEVERNFTSEPAQYVVPNLNSSTQYDFKLFTVFDGVRSTGANLTASTAPSKAEDFTAKTQNDTSLTLQWKNENKNISYTLMFNGHKENFAGQQLSNPAEHTVSNLQNAKRYNFTLVTVFANIRCAGVDLSGATAPRDATGFKAQSQTETTITLQWNKVDDIRDYLLVINGTKNESVSASSADLVTHTVTNRQSGTLTSFILYTVFANITSRGVSYSAATVPPKVSSVKVTERRMTEITLQWERAREDWNYTFYINSTNEHNVHLAGGSNIISHSVESLKPGTIYEFHVTTEFERLKSVPYEDRTVTSIDCTVVDWRVTESTIQGVVEGAFTKATATNGSLEVVSSGSNTVLFTGLYPGATYNIMLMYEELEQCSLIVTTIPPMLTAQCKDYAAGYSIYIEWDRPNGIWNFVEVNVSGQTFKVGENGERFAKLPNFQPAKKYQVSISSQSGHLRSAPYVFTCATDAGGVIAGAFFGVLLFVILIGVVIFIMLKRPDIIRQKMSLIGGSRATVKKSKGIPAAQFPSHFNELSANGNRGFSQEYEALYPVGTEQTQKAAVMQENKAKNRFILPYDRCRVKLASSNSNDDYINASYMPGYNSEREYIGAQGPMSCTVNDFWRMIFEQKVKCIVMVTDCIEGGQTKCEQYWPADSKPHLCGDLTVSTIAEKKESKWTLREFKIKHRSTSEERLVKHFHFTAWPDHGIPLGSEAFIQFRALVRRYIQTEAEGTPTVVHGSAGVGRTGTFIALDVLLQWLEKEKVLDVNGFVHRMRLNRPHMVQTESQYVFLHQCIMDSLQQSDEEHIYENEDLVYANNTALREFHECNVSS